MAAKLIKSPVLPAKDRWIFTSRLRLRCYEFDSMMLSKTVNITGMPPQATVISGLEKYTRYSFGVDYFGHLNSSVDYNLVANISSHFRTAEDGKNQEYKIITGVLMVGSSRFSIAVDVHCN